MQPSALLTAVLKEEIPLIKVDKIPTGFLETVDMMFADGSFILDRERFNILASFWHLPPTSEEFFTRYFPNAVTSIEVFKQGVDRFIVEALWHFGDLERAYLKLTQLENIQVFFDEHSFNVDEFEHRLPWTLVEDIAPSDRGFLGYVSGQRPKQQKDLLDFAWKVIAEIEDAKKEYIGLPTSEITNRVLAKLSSTNPDIKQKIEEFNKLSGLKELDLFSAVELEQSKKALEAFKKEIDQTIEKVDRLKCIGKKNQEHYLRNIETIDVYVATSMRNDEEYLDMFNFVNTTFSDPDIMKLNLRYFDPTLCYCDSRIDKGVIECLLVRSAKVTIYCAQEGDTFGKDSELAATLAQGKPVIVYVPVAKEADSDIASITEPTARQRRLSEKQAKLESRARTFQEFHPLGLQVGLYDGVARGVIVVRTPEDCAKILYKTLTNTLQVKISFEEHGLVLRETQTNSVLRVMTGWGVLASCFWNQFNKTQNPKSGLPI